MGAEHLFQDDRRQTHIALTIAQMSQDVKFWSMRTEMAANSCRGAGGAHCLVCREKCVRDTIFIVGHSPPPAILGWPPHGWAVRSEGGGLLYAPSHLWARGRTAVVQRKPLAGWPSVDALLVPPFCAQSW